MAFTHGKKARLWCDQWELTSYFNEFNMMAKAGIAETTVFGRGAKTYIGGIKEGQITAKGYFGALVTDVADGELSQALGNQTNMNVTFSPTGLTAAGSRVIVAYAAETDLGISAPVAGVVASNFSAQADSGLSTGVMLYDPTSAAITTATTTNGTGVNDRGQTDSPTTAVTVGSNGVNVSTFTGGAAVLNATNPQAANFPTSGYLSVVTSGAATAIVFYTGTTTTTFTGVTLVSGSGTVATGGAIVAPYFTAGGLVCNVQVFTTGAADTITVNLQHSDDNATWVTLGTTVTGITIPGGYQILIPYGTVILRYLRAQIVTVGATISATLLVSAARQ
jgi:hypothetical protein